MPRSNFGGTVETWIAARFHFAGRTLAAFAPGSLTLWDSFEGGTRHTDLLLNGESVQTIPVPATGQVPVFQGPDNVKVMWADAGGDFRVLLVTTDVAVDLSNELSTRIPTAEKGAAGGVATLDASGRLVQTYDATLAEGEFKVENVPVLPAAKVEDFPADRILDPPWVLPDDVAAAPDLTADLPNPLLWAHRGSDLYPENSMEGFRAMVNAGCAGIEIDCRLTVDGHVVIMHDATVDRTTDGTGSVADMTAAEIMRLNIKPGANPAWPTTGIHPPLLEDVLREFGDRVFISVELKTDATAPKAKALLDKHLQRKSNVCVVGNARSRVQDFLTDGRYLVAVQEPTADPAQLAADGVWQCNINKADVTQTLVDNLHAEGVRAQIYNLYFREEVENVIAMGIDGAMVDDWEWLSQSAPLLTTDPYDRTVWYPGNRLSSSYNNSDTAGAYFQGGYGLVNTEVATGLTASESGFRMGWASPVNGDPAADSFTVTFQLMMRAWNATVSNVFLAWSNKDQGVFGQGGTSTGGTFDGCGARIRRNGTLTLFDITNGNTQTSVNATTSANTVGGAWETFELEVTPTTVTLRRPGTGESVSANMAGMNGGGFLYFSAGGSESYIRDVVIS